MFGRWLQRLTPEQVAERAFPLIRQFNENIGTVFAVHKLTREAINFDRVFLFGLATVYEMADFLPDRGEQSGIDKAAAIEQATFNVIAKAVFTVVLRDFGNEGNRSRDEVNADFVSFQGRLSAEYIRFRDRYLATLRPLSFEGAHEQAYLIKAAELALEWISDRMSFGVSYAEAKKTDPHKPSISVVMTVPLSDLRSGLRRLLSRA